MEKSAIRTAVRGGVWIAALAAPAAALSDPDDFCVGDPCVISASLTADPDIVLDFGDRDVQLSGTLEIGDLPYTLDLCSAGSITLGEVNLSGSGDSGDAVCEPKFRRGALDKITCKGE